MNGIFCAMLLAGIFYAAATGQADAAQRALMQGGSEAAALCLELCGTYAFFGGVMGLLREGGAADALAGLLKRPVTRLMRFAPGEERALGDICMNLAADMLGMGGAATPAGLRAMRTMASAQGEKGRASAAMLMFLTLNAVSVQLVPTTMIALRAQAGAKHPADIVLPTLLASAASAVCGVALCRLFAAWEERRGEQ